MRLCDQCSEPAVKDLLAGCEGLQSTGLCYLHAAESGLLGISLDDVLCAAEECGYPANALLFVSEALARKGNVRSVSDVCRAVLQAAKQRFGSAGSQVLGNWRIVARSDIGAIFDSLVRAGMLETRVETQRREFDRSFTVQDILDEFGDL